MRPTHIMHTRTHTQEVKREAWHTGSIIFSPSVFQQLNLYFSRDGGFTWFEVESGYWQFQFAAQGAIVAAIKKFRPTSEVTWSCDEGGSFSPVSFLTHSTLRSIRVIGMLTEPGEKALHIT